MSKCSLIENENTAEPLVRSFLPRRDEVRLRMAGRDGCREVKCSFDEQEALPNRYVALGVRRRRKSDTAIPRDR